MNYSTAIFLVNDNVRAIRASYDIDHTSGKPVPKDVKTFKTMDPNLKVGDFIVVPTSTRHMMTINRVEEVDVEVLPESSLQLDWVVAVVDKMDHDAVVAMEERGIVAIKSSEKRRAREELVAKLKADNPDLNMLGDVAPPALAAPIGEPA